MTATPEDQRAPLGEGESVGVYRIERLLGSGGFGLTYLARDEYLDRLVALKEFMPLGISARRDDGGVEAGAPGHAERFDQGLKRFLTEARLLGRVDHPNVTRVLAAFERNGTGYMAMAYESGTTLDTHIRRRRKMDQRELRRLALGLLDAVESIHAAGILHRDIKPSNILVTRDGCPLLLDFGSATRVRGDRCDAGISTVSPGYSPIELYQPERYPQGPWTDIYGIAAILYRIITGVRPAPPAGCRDPREAPPTESGVFANVAISAASAGAGEYSHEFLTAIDRALETHPDNRPRSATAWREELLVVAEEGAAEADPQGERRQRKPRPLGDLAASRNESNEMLLVRARRLLAERPASDRKRAGILECCRRVLTTDPTHAEARKMMKQLMFEALAESRSALNRGAAERARTLLEFADSVFPGDANVEHLRGLLRARAGKGSVAARFASQAKGKSSAA